MSKKLGRNGNKEGSIYNTIQKIDRKQKRLNFVCDTCKNCDNWSICNNRTGTNKCQKCIECTACLKKEFVIDFTVIIDTPHKSLLMMVQELQFPMQILEPNL